MSTGQGSGAAKDASVRAKSNITAAEPTAPAEPAERTEVERLTEKVEKYESHLKAAKQALEDAKAAAGKGD